ncbi:MAG: response regulator [Candidatus Pristimantibacillus sp.]
MRAILIDDEEIAIDVLEILLQEAGGVSVVGKFGLVTEAVEQVAELKPDIIFLDIEMPGMNGLAGAEPLLSRCPEAEIIFVTAHHQYAVDAFETNAIGYLLKPVAKDRLVRALERYASIHGKAAGRRGSEQLSSEISSAGAEGDASEELPQQALHLKVLGSLELYTSDGKLFTWRTKKTKELFAYLWHHSGEPVYRYHILDDLWPSLTPDRAQTIFHTTLYNLRNLLKAAGHPEMVEFGDERYRMDIQCIFSDKGRLDRHLRLGCQGDEIDELLSLYRGEYLETEHYSWAESRRYEYHSSYISCLETLSDKAIGWAKEQLLRKLIELEPYSEKYYKWLLAYFAETDNRAEADRMRELKKHRLGQVMESRE